MSNWQLDPAHTVVSFTGKHMMITKVRGIFKGVTGTIDFDEANPASARVDVTIPAGTIETGMEARDNHLRSADFLDAESAPDPHVRQHRDRAEGRSLGDHGRPDHPRRHPFGHPAGRSARHRHRDGRPPACGLRGDDEDQALRLGPDVERRPRGGGWLVSDEIAIDLEVAADELAQTVIVERISRPGSLIRSSAAGGAQPLAASEPGPLRSPGQATGGPAARYGAAKRRVDALGDGHRTVRPASRAGRS